MPRSAQPRGITALSHFFAMGSLIALTSTVSLLFPGSFLEPMWRLNPRARTAFASLGLWAPVLLGVVSAACAVAAPFEKGWRRSIQLAKAAAPTWSIKRTRRAQARGVRPASPAACLTMGP